MLHCRKQWGLIFVVQSRLSIIERNWSSQRSEPVTKQSVVFCCCHNKPERTVDDVVLPSSTTNLVIRKIGHCEESNTAVAQVK
ncbi:hypothetical protein Pelo_1520 [Pelomyxa schiedti]|nr:hypothetical protein Pelo_1520 [Pelomyxa schiedti]